jgi:hypothetical protein
MSRSKLLLASAICVAIGAVGIAFEIRDHGFSRAVVLGITAGALIDAMLAIVIWRNWNRRLTKAERREMTHVRRATGSFAPLAAGIGTVITVAFGAGSGSANVFFYSALYALLSLGALLAVPIALARKDLIETGVLENED